MPKVNSEQIDPGVALKVRSKSFSKSFLRRVTRPGLAAASLLH